MHRITESPRLEKTHRTTQSNHSPITNGSLYTTSLNTTSKRSSNTSRVSRTPPPLWAAQQLTTPKHSSGGTPCRPPPQPQCTLRFSPPRQCWARGCNFFPFRGDSPNPHAGESAAGFLPVGGCYPGLQALHAGGGPAGVGDAAFPPRELTHSPTYFFCCC